MIAQLPIWPLWLGLGALIVASFGLFATLIGAQHSHRTTRNVGVMFCDECATPCTEAYPCLCCRCGKDRR